MTLSIAFLFLIIITMIVVMALEKLPADTLAVTVMVTLIVGGFVTPAEGIAGLSNQATVTILALMMLTIGLETTGVINSLGRRLKKILVGREWKNILGLTLMAGICSAFISTTAIVIVFMRILVKLSKKIPVRLSRLLMPLSFAGILGGSCTLMGTSTNLLVAAIGEEAGLKAFNIFEFSHLGAIFFISGVLYLVLIGRHLIPVRHQPDEDLNTAYTSQEYITEVSVSSDSELIGKELNNISFFDEDEIEMVRIIRRGRSVFPQSTDALLTDDVLLIKGSVDKLADLRNHADFHINYAKRRTYEKQDSDEVTLCEVIIQPNSRLFGKTLNQINLIRPYNATALAVKTSIRNFPPTINNLKIKNSDTLLMEVPRENFEYFYNLKEFVVLQEHEDLAAKDSKRFTAGFIVFAVIGLAAANLLPILTGALLGCVAMFLTGCLNLQRAYRRVEWNVYFLLAGVIPLGTAMENTGASQLIADTFVETFGEVSPRMLVAMLYLITTLLSAVISNNATAILFAPIAISIAGTLGVDPRPLLITIMFAANFSFITPIGYQTNTLIYSVGDYQFFDYVKVGGILSLLIWALAIWLIPAFYF